MNTWDNMNGKAPRPKGYKPANNTKSPRSRPGQNFPGGKHMRRALKALSIRQNNYSPTSSPSGHAMTKPGGMTGKI